ncbi:MAG: hypothetical protein OES47_15315, partial [Acidobacteriota bacterium]|nr:hypothetical protein [Acidobacteriota bacterium]
QRVTLSDGQRTARGIWKTVDIFKPIQRFDDGTVEMSFRDSWENEIAAYELDKLLGLSRVPPVVKRRWRRQVGSLQLWLEDVMTEAERIEKKILAPDTEEWNRQMYTVRLVHNLCDDSDFNNVGNLLVDKDFRVWIIDHSRSFRNNKELRNPGDLDRFSRDLLDKIRRLDSALLTERLGRWLTKKQIETLLIRRDLILERADMLVESLGEEKVLYP